MTVTRDDIARQREVALVDLVDRLGISLPRAKGSPFA